MIELPHHPWFVGGQFHPEFKSRPRRPHPLFREFIRAALAYQEGASRRAEGGRPELGPGPESPQDVPGAP